MSYIGASPTSATFLTNSFSGDGTTTSFTLTVAPASSSSILVAVSGVLQDPATYAVVGTSLNFTGAPPSGTANIIVRFLGIPASNVATASYRTVTEFTATAAQTTFSVPSYTPGFIDVYRNGVMLGSADYTATNGTTVVLATGATSGDLIEVISFYVSSIYNAISNTAGSVNSTNIADGAVGTAEIADGAVTAAKLDSGLATQWVTSGANISYTTGNVGIGTSSPQNQLHINGTSTGYARFQSTNRTFTIGSLASAYGFVINDVDAGQERMRIDAAGLFQFNSGYGSVATAYGCRAWVNFDGSSGGIRASGGVSSITRRSSGCYTFNFATAMPDANYAVQVTTSATQGVSWAGVPQLFHDAPDSQVAPTASSFIFLTSPGGGTDRPWVCVSVHR